MTPLHLVVGSEELYSACIVVYCQVLYYLLRRRRGAFWETDIYIYIV